MSSRFPVDDDVRAAVARAFRDEDRERVLDALRAASVDARPLIVLLADGSPEQVDALVQANLDDWRNIRAMASNRFEGPKAEDIVQRCRAIGMPVPAPWNQSLPETIEANVRAFVAQRFTRRVEQVHDRLQLQADLGLTAYPDGPEFIAAFADKFSVDIKSFRLERHFDAREWDGLLRELLRFVLLRPKPPRTPITVGDLVAAAKSGRLDVGASRTS